MPQNVHKPQKKKCKQKSRLKYLWVVWHEISVCNKVKKKYFNSIFQTIYTNNNHNKNRLHVNRLTKQMRKTES